MASNKTIYLTKIVKLFEIYTNHTSMKMFLLHNYCNFAIEIKQLNIYRNEIF